MTGPSLENKNLVKKIDAFALMNFSCMDSATALAGYLSPIVDTPLTSILPIFHSISKTPPRAHFANGEEEERCSLLGVYIFQLSVAQTQDTTQQKTCSISTMKDGRGSNELLYSIAAPASRSSRAHSSMPSLSAASE